MVEVHHLNLVWLRLEEEEECNSADCSLEETWDEMEVRQQSLQVKEGETTQRVVEGKNQMVEGVMTCQILVELPNTHYCLSEVGVQVRSSLPGASAE